MTVNQRIKILRIEKNYTQSELAKKMGYKSRSAIHKIENGLRDINQTQIQKFAKALNTTPSYLMGWEDEPTLPHPDLIPLKGRTKKIPLIGEVACGNPICANREYELYSEVSADIHADFCLKAKGDSMIGARIHDGDIVFIKEMCEVCNGEIAAVIVDDNDVTLKRIYVDNEAKQITLVAENTSYPPIVLNGERANHCRVLGRAVGFQSILK